MLNILEDLLPRWQAGESVAVSTVIHTSDSAPLPTGSSQMATVAGEVFGSVSGGCVEGAVYEENLAVLRGAPPRVHTYGFSDDDAWAVGLTCGGTLEVFTEPVNPLSLPWLEEICQAVLSGDPIAVATVTAGVAGGPAAGTKLLIRGDSTSGTLGNDTIDDNVAATSRELLRSGCQGLFTYPYPCSGEPVQVFIEVFSSRPRLLIFGAVDFSAALAEAGSFLGYRVTVCDARQVFASPKRFPCADDVVCEWPHNYLAEQLALGLVDDRTAVCILTHDAKFDIPLLEEALRIPFSGYVGAMGSRRTHADRLERLAARGLSEGDISRLHSPIGLDLGGRTPQETAVSIVAEILAHRYGRSALPLERSTGAIHGPAYSPPPMTALAAAGLATRRRALQALGPCTDLPGTVR